MELVKTILYTVLALGVLVSFHEFGHFWVARRCGIKVIRFSIGFGRPIVSWLDKTGTEYVIAWIPLGGYVRMVDEREEDVAPEDLPYAFNRKPLWQRMAVVLAGPVANFVLAVALFWVMFMHGVTGVSAVVGEVLPGTVADVAGVQPGQQIVAIDGRPTQTFSELNKRLLWRLGDEGDIEITTVYPGADQREVFTAPLGDWDIDSKNPNALKSIGIVPQYRRVLITQIMDDSPAGRAGLQQGDLVDLTDGQAIRGAAAWSKYIAEHVDQQIVLTVERDGGLLELQVTPQSTIADGQTVIRIGVGLSYEPWPEEYIHRSELSVMSALAAATAETWQTTVFTLHLLKKMVMGDISAKHLSGPISIATVAGQTAERGLVDFLGFMALLSVSLGVLNLLPIPVLDGGHLMYYLIEAVKGSPVSENVQMIGYRIGLFLVMGLMLFALYNDVLRLG